MKKPWRPISKKHLIRFLASLASTQASGIPIQQALAILETDEPHGHLQILIFKIKKQIEGGTKLSSALNTFPEYFPPSYPQLVRIGEETGRLEQLLHLAKCQLEKHEQLKSKQWQALAYPLFVFGLVTIITFSMLYYIVPMFYDYFRDAHATIPYSTELLFRLSRMLHDHLLIILLLNLLSICCIYRYRAKCTTFILKIPILKHYMRCISHGHFASMLSIILSSGVSLTHGIHLLRSPSPFSLNDKLQIMQEMLHRGTSFHTALVRAGFSGSFVQMIKIGETSGRLEEVLQHLGEYYENEAEKHRQYFIKFLEPLIMLIQGALIGCIMVVLYLPIFNLGNAF